jgi:hypothetical protein
MKWGEFKRWVEERGIKDNTEFSFMDWKYEPRELESKKEEWQQESERIWWIF